MNNEDSISSEGSNQCLETLDLGVSVLTLEEALQTFEPGQESELFCMSITKEYLPNKTNKKIN
jgi:hypothetical protein